MNTTSIINVIVFFFFAFVFGMYLALAYIEPSPHLALLTISFFYFIKLFEVCAPNATCCSCRLELSTPYFFMLHVP